MSRNLRIYVFAVVSAAVLAVAAAFAVCRPEVTGHGFVLAMMLVTLATLTYAAPVKLAPKRHHVLSAAVQTVAFLALAPGPAAVLMAVGTAAGNRYFLKRKWWNTAFNAAQVALGMLSAGFVYHALAPTSLTHVNRNLGSYLAVIPAGLAVYATTTLLVDGAAAIQRRTSPFANWWGIHAPSILPNITLIGIGAATATIVDRHTWLLLLAVAPVTVLRSVMRESMRFDDEAAHRAETIAAHVGATAGPRLHRLVDATDRLAELLGLADDERRRLTLAARLTALGPALMMVDAHGSSPSDICLPDQVEAAAVFVATTLQLPAVADAIRYHHERFDGTGPRRLVGNDIPLESRILAVCESWAALTSAAVHRSALTFEQAAVTLRAGAAAHWDPYLVDLFTRHVLATDKLSRSAPTPVAALGPAPAG